ncbi:hypothetical protein OQJ86_07125 [Vibrio sp. Sgm 5]|nr:hypothetical protein [Vibrio sp. Sgm 5]MCX2789541.1 hypothetical protein [Vibrio sp. Sgm 5]
MIEKPIAPWAPEIKAFLPFINISTYYTVRIFFLWYWSKSIEISKNITSFNKKKSVTKAPWTNLFTFGVVKINESVTKKVTFIPREPIKPTLLLYKPNNNKIENIISEKPTIIEKLFAPKYEKGILVKGLFSTKGVISSASKGKNFKKPNHITKIESARVLVMTILSYFIQPQIIKR